MGWDRRSGVMLRGRGQGERRAASVLSPSLGDHVPVTPLWLCLQFCSWLPFGICPDDPFSSLLV